MRHARVNWLHDRGRVVKRIGLLGGSFNPAHEGHQAAVAPRHPRARARRSVVAGLAGQSAQGRKRAWPRSPRASRRRGDGAACADPSDGIEKRLKTRYTADTLTKLPRLYPRHRFIWLMGADNLAQFHRWERWRHIARQVPIAVIARPGYDRQAHASPAMGWLRRVVRPAGQAKNWTRWRLPALVLLRFRPDPTSATRLRAADPAWHRRFLGMLQNRVLKEPSPSPHFGTDRVQP
jgi:nicotinate-nucleotide adenylyltransferase